MGKNAKKKKIRHSPRLYFETIRFLGLAQAFHQFRHRLGRFSAPKPRPHSAAGRLRVLASQCERARQPANPDALLGEFTAWGTTRRLDLQRPWEAPDLGRSWNYPIHYFEGLPALAATRREAAGGPESIARFIDEWITAHPPGRGVAWDPYPTALRIVNWADTLEILGEHVPPATRERIAASLWIQAAWLSRRLERHLQGTHLLKDLKALLVAAALFDAAPARQWARQAETQWRRQIARQVLGDGSHVECSVMYHGLALGDLLDVLNWRLGSAALQAETTAIAQRMVNYLASVQTPAGEYPLFGDASYDAVPAPRELIAYASRLGIAAQPSIAGWQFHADAGLAVWRDARHYCIVKAGGIGPQHVAAHAHCDTQSYEWHVEGKPIVVDSGVRSYEVGAERFASRRTQAHNTLCIDGREQQEIWAAFRIARRSQVHATVSEDGLESRLIPWFDRRLTIVRRIQCDASGVRIQDRVEGSGIHRIEDRLHLHPDCVVRAGGEITVERAGVRVEIERTPVFDRVFMPAESSSVHCERAGIPRANCELWAQFDARLPYAAETRLKYRQPGS